MLIAVMPSRIPEAKPAKVVAPDRL